MKTMIPATIGQPHGGATPHDVSTVRRTALELTQLSDSRFITARPTQSSRRERARRDRAKKLIEANEHMHRHIARELHDDIGQRLSLLSIKLGLLQQFQAIDDPGGNLAESLRDLDTLISDVHHLSHSLHSSRIEHLGLSAALQELCERHPEACGMHIDLIAGNVPESLPPGFALCFFRIAQESLNNAINHSGASRVEIELALKDDVLTMTIRDFGSGFDRKHTLDGLGLITMEERMAAVGGTLTIESEPSSGTTVTALAELHPEAVLVGV